MHPAQTPVPQARRDAFAALLRRHMEDAGVGARELGRRLDPANPSTGQRNVFRYLAAKTLPAEPMQHALEDALGVGRGTLTLEPQEVAPLGDTFRGDGGGVSAGSAADVRAEPRPTRRRRPVTDKDAA